MALAWAVDEDADDGEAQHVRPILRRLRSDDGVEEGVQPVGVAATGGYSVLVADDEESLRSSLAAILETAGHRVVEAENGQVALNLLREQDFDVLILDLYMPKADGMDVLRRIDVPPPVVIVYSAFAYFSLNAVRDEVGAKVFRFMRKPVPPRELIEAVNEAAAELDD